MPRYFFHVDGGSEQPDTEGTELAGMGQVRSEAVHLTGEILRDMGGRFWGHPEWTLTVTDQTGAEVLGLRVSANARLREPASPAMRGDDGLAKHWRGVMLAYGTGRSRRSNAR